MSWNPAQYNRFADERALPLRDLLDSISAQISALPCNEALDLGCGSGVAIPPIRALCPQARITALDSSAEMLEAAKIHAGSDTRLLRADIGNWTPDRAFNLVLSNAALQWLNDHATLFPRLMSWLAPGGILAVQMPNNWGEPSHRLMAEAATSGPWREKLAELLRQTPVGDAVYYEDLLRPISQSCRVWENIYTHKLTGDDAVYRWIEGTSLKPLLDALEGDERDAFAASYKAALAAAYPRDKAGVTEFPFRRIFIIATAHD